LIFVWGFSLQTPAKAETWFELKSENFTVYSNAKKEVAYDLIEELEYFRFYLQIITNVKDTTTELPHVVFAMRNKISFKSMTGIRGGVVGFYFAHPRTTVSFSNIDYDFTRTSRMKDRPGKQVLFHEYTHHFMFRYTRFNYPLWYSEGFADYLGAFSYEDGVATIGQIIPGRLRSLGGTDWFSLKTILASNKTVAPYIRNRGMTYMVYAQGWFFIHYLNTRADYRQALQKYLVANNNGEEFEEAFVSSFNMSVKQMEDELWAYWKNQKMPYIQLTLKNDNFNPQITVRKLSQEEGDFARLRGKTYLYSDEGRLFARKKVLREEIKTTNFKDEARLVLADMEFFTEEYDEAEKLAKEVLQDTLDHPKALGILGGINVDRALEMEAGEERDQLFIQAREYLRKAISLDSTDVVANRYLGRSYTFGPEGNYQEGLEAFYRAYKLLPQYDITRLEMALLEVKTGQLENALAEFKDLVEWSRAESIKKAAKFCLDKIVEENDSDSCTFLNLDQFEGED